MFLDAASLSLSLSQMWNSVGTVRGYNDEQDNAIDVEFHDTAVHHAMHLTNSPGHTMTDVSQEAVLLACPSTNELARYAHWCPVSDDIFKLTSGAWGKRDLIELI